MAGVNGCPWSSVLSIFLSPPLKSTQTELRPSLLSLEREEGGWRMGTQTGDTSMTVSNAYNRRRKTWWEKVPPGERWGVKVSKFLHSIANNRGMYLSSPVGA